MAKIPNFAGTEKLSLMDLQALADAVAGQERVLPPAPLSGRLGSRKYSLANYNRVDESTGVSIPGNSGLIESVAYDSSVSEPQINEGKILLPPSGGGSDITEVVYSFDASQPGISGQTITHPYAQTNTVGSSVAGVMSGAILVSHVSAPLIENGKIYLPLAQYSESYGVTLGMVGKIEYNSAVSAPSITDGVITLPSGSETITEVLYTPSASAPVIESGIIKHPYAQTALGSSVAGVVSGEISVSHVSAPLIENGKIYLPLAQYRESYGVTLGMVGKIEYNSAVSAPSIIDGVITLPSGSGTVLGLRDMYGNPIAWADLYTSGAQQTSLAQFTAGGTTLTLCANFSDGYLNFEFRS